MSAVPVILFAYARPAHLRRVLDCLKANRVPRIVAFADGARGAADSSAVAETRALLHAIDWCQVRLVERPANLGLGANVVAGVSEVAKESDRFIVWEDDLIAVPGTYEWICAALERYASEPKVMSISAWTHPRVTPTDAGPNGYFDGRAECWVWGAYARSWRGMDSTSASEEMAKTADRGVVADAYGADLPEMARAEKRKNIWAVRWLYHHLASGGISLRPRTSFVEHIGFDPAASHAATAVDWANPRLGTPPRPPIDWPAPVENPGCATLWRSANPGRNYPRRLWAKFRARLARLRPERS